MSHEIKITHLTTVHKRYDTRIFLKECRSLAAVQKYKVSLIVADGKGDEEKDGVKILDIGLYNDKLKRIFLAPKKLLKKALEIDSDLYHIHDPELISVGLKLKRAGKKIVFDSHEDFLEKIKARKWIPSIARGFLSRFFRRQFKKASEKFDGIVAAAPHILRNSCAIKSEVIRNFPEYNYIKNLSSKKNSRDPSLVLYTGGLTEFKGIEQVIEALFEKCSVNWKLVIAGISHGSVFNRIGTKFKDKRITYLGKVEYGKVVDLMSKASVGVVCNQPVHDYQNAIPNKLFEYMAAGLPVVCSNFKYWTEIMEETGAGITCVPDDISSIAAAIDKILSDKENAALMGIKGRQAVENKYNWENESEKFLNLYKEVLN